MWGVAGIVTAFILLASVLLWLLIASKTKVVVKVVLVALVMWYGIVLYHVPSNIMGWATSVESIEELPQGAWVQSIMIKEPNKKTKEAGYIYFVLVVYEQPGKKKSTITLNPKEAFTYQGVNEPRIYRIDYDKELHKQITQAKRDQKKSGRGARLFTKENKENKDKNKGSSDKEGPEDKAPFKIINPGREITKKLLN